MKQEALSSLIIFDDEEDILVICSSVLRKKGWRVETFTDVNNVVDRVLQIKPAVIIMDNHIPEVGGVIATQLLKKHHLLKDIPVIFITANLQIEVLSASAGAEYFMPKPFTTEQLEAAIQRAVAGLY